MLDTDTKRRIDTARDILVGKVPDPKSHVEQITIALIYKFMDDMDAESEEFGGKRKFFAGEFARYGWAKLMRSGLGGHETLNLYAEAIAKMPENPGIPLLFRDIFKNAYLPYRDPETLKMFLKVIDDFTYDHSERLGDAFEYLLSVLGSQGDAGQFRTPRHIIDFMVEVIDPKKNETVLDPACGTAGFLIFSYKHILKANTDDRGNSILTPDEKGRLARNFKGYDISPDMVRLSLVNLYLHGFADPHIAEYDTLSSLDKWNEYSDVILANPPFMSPKGGIKPHNRFSVQSKRSEVLFVDYMAEHLTPSGRAGIIVPEGIIFQSQTAYKQLRKMLVEEYLVAVVSLPAGVFNPYSGVKTSILILDKSLARKTNTIAFFKVENDGFGLGAQRREIDKNNLPQAHAEIGEYLRCLRAGESVEDLQPTLGLIVEKEKIAANGEYNLGGERYRVNGAALTAFPFRSIKEIAAEVQAGFASGQSGVDIVGVPHLRPMNINEEGEFVPEGTKYISEDEYKGRKGYALEPGDVLFNNTNSKELIGKTCLIETPIRGGFSNHMTRIRVNRDLCVPRFLALLLHSAWRKGQFSERATRWVGQAGINVKSLSEFEIPLPPLEVQKEIVAEIEGYQKVINGARAVLDNYRPHIPINPDWPMVELGDSGLFKIESGGTPKSGVAEYWGGPIAWATLVDLPASDFVTEIRSTQRTITERGLSESSAKLVPENSVIVSTRATIGRIGINRVPIATNQGFKNVIIEDMTRAVPEYVAFALTNLVPRMEAWATGGTFKELSKSKFSELEIPLPRLATQQAIVAEIEAEQALVAANRELIARFEQKIQTTLARVWGEGKESE
jgi:type I restriction enzyme M protein